MLSVRQLAQYILHNKVYGCETTFVLLKRQYIHAGIRTRSLPLRWCQLKCSVIIVMAPRRVPVSVPYTLNKDERFQTWLVGFLHAHFDFNRSDWTLTANFGVWVHTRLAFARYPVCISTSHLLKNPQILPSKIMFSPSISLPVSCLWSSR